MNATPSVFLSIILCYGLSITLAMAQLPTSHLERIAPYSAKAGTTIDVNLSGSNLEGLTELRFTHPAIVAQPVLLPAVEGLSQRVQDGSKFRVTIGSDVPAGIYEARVGGYFGLSTARPFVVASAESNEISEQGDHSTRELAMNVPLDSVITGSVAARGVDWFSFDAKADQRVLLNVFGERIDSRMDGQLIVYDSQGREVVRDRGTYGRDPFVEVCPAADGRYYVALSDILYRGSGNHFYRLHLSTGPHIDFIDPPAGVPGSTETYTVFGRNLPGGSYSKSATLGGKPLESLDVKITLPAEPTVPSGLHPGTTRQAILPGFDFSIGGSNSVKIGFATAPVLSEPQENEVVVVEYPVEVAGCFEAQGDEDVYQFHGKAGDPVAIEVIADRMGSLVDPVLVVQRVAIEDSMETLVDVAEIDDMRSFFSVHGKDSIDADTRDCEIQFTPEVDADYRVSVINQFGNGDRSLQYRLAIRKPTPDFQLIACTERPLATGRAGFSVTPLLRRNAKWGVRILAPRQDQFQGDIVVTAEGLPDGVTAEPLVLSGITDEGVLVLSASDQINHWSGEIRIIGRATIGENVIERKANLAALVWGHIFADSIRVRSRLTTSMPLGVNPFEDAPIVLSTPTDSFTVRVGEKFELPLTVKDNGMRKGDLTVEPYGLYGMLRSPPTVNVGESQTEAVLAMNFAPNGNFKVEPGRYQFALHGTGVTRYQHNSLATEQLKVQQTEIGQRLEQLKKMLASARERLDASKKQADQIASALKAASPVATTELKRQQAEVNERINSETAAVEQLSSSLANAEKIKTLIDQRADAATKRSVEKQEKFAAWSDLITVTILPAEEKK